MNHKTLKTAALLAAASLCACNDNGATTKTDTVELASNEQKVSYSIGQNFADQLSQSGLDVDLNALKAGIDDVFTQSEPRLSDDAMQAAQDAVMQELQQRQAAEQEAQASANAAAGAAFLADNKQQEGVQVTDSGLQYKVLTQGEGALPAATDTVKVHYRGTLIDGTEFDSSYRRGEPAEFPVTAVIGGWTEALQLMPVGSKYQLFIPSNLAYGPGGTGPNGPIGPNATLVFEVELLEIITPAE